jgi:hypothetical protein
LGSRQAIHTKEDLRGQQFIGCINDLLFDQDLNFTDEFYPGANPNFRTSTVIAQMNAVVAGSGIGVIPLN